MRAESILTATRGQVCWAPGEDASASQKAIEFEQMVVIDLCTPPPSPIRAADSPEEEEGANTILQLATAFDSPPCSHKVRLRLRLPRSMRRPLNASRFLCSRDGCTLPDNHPGLCNGVSINKRKRDSPATYRPSWETKKNAQCPPAPLHDERDAMQQCVEKCVEIAQHVSFDPRRLEAILAHMKAAKTM